MIASRQMALRAVRRGVLLGRTTLQPCARGFVLQAVKVHSPCAPSSTFSRLFSATSKSHLASVQDDMRVKADEQLTPSGFPVMTRQNLQDVTEDVSSLQGRIDKRIYQALSSKPFNFEKFSEVQSSVFTALPNWADPMEVDMPDGSSRDMLIKAKTGTGKTIGFLVPAFERRLQAIWHARRGRFTKPFLDMLKRHRGEVDFDSLDDRGKEKLERNFIYNTVGALIISPTRELAMQIAKEAKNLATYLGDFHVHTFIGGESKYHQMRDFSRGRPDIVVATPGRLLDCLHEDPVLREPMEGVQTLVFDEADTLLDMGFKKDIDEIMSYLPAQQDRATLMFSATVSKDIKRIAGETLDHNHVYKDLVPAGEENAHMHVPQTAHMLNGAEDLMPTLTRLCALDQMENPGHSKILVFASTKRMTQTLSQLFNYEGLGKSTLPAGSGTRLYEIHADMDQSKRVRASDTFRGDQSGASVLITSDVSARGVDYKGVTRVIQVGIPSSQEQYIHRIGRTGRAGASGKADIILLPFEQGFVKAALHEMPVKRVQPDALESELEEKIKAFDENPDTILTPEVKAFMNQSRADDHEERNRSRKRDVVVMPPTRPSKWPVTPLAGRLSTPALTQACQDAYQRIDEDRVVQTMMSSVGFYASHLNGVGASMNEMVEALKGWAVLTGNLEKPPYISEDFLHRLGVSQKMERESRRRFGGRAGSSRDRGGFGSDRRGGSGGGGFGSDRRGGGGFNSDRRGGGGFDRGGGGGFDRSSGDGGRDRGRFRDRMFSPDASFRGGRQQGGGDRRGGGGGFSRRDEAY